MSVELFVECPKCSKRQSGFPYNVDSIDWDDQEFEVKCDECKNILIVKIINIDTECKFKN